MLLEVRHQGSYGRSLLTNGHINTIYGFTCVVKTLLVDDCVNSDGSLAGLTVADDKLTLTAANRDH